MSCERFIERLVDGARGAEDPELQSHLSTCLRCYRAAADLRDLPQLTDLLREGQADQDRQGGPGEAFWRSFPDGVGAAWTRGAGQDAASAAVKAASAGEDHRRWRPVHQLRAWLRRPMPAAFAGAAFAAAVAFLVVRPLRNTSALVAVPVNGSLIGAASEDGLLMIASALDDLPLPRGQGLDESVRDLDAASLGVVLEGLDRELGSGVVIDPDLPSEAGSDTAAASEALEDLDLEGLQALREGLGRSI